MLILSWEPIKDRTKDVVFPKYVNNKVRLNLYNDRDQVFSMVETKNTAANINTIIENWKKIYGDFSFRCCKGQEFDNENDIHTSIGNYIKQDIICEVNRLNSTIRNT